MRAAPAVAVLMLLAACRARDVARPGPATQPTPVTPAGETPVSTAPAGLLEPGAVDIIQQHLQSRGYLKCPCNGQQIDDRTREALARFQREGGLPTTGLPTFETVERLGLRVDQIFRRAGSEATHGPDGGT